MSSTGDKTSLTSSNTGTSSPDPHSDPTSRAATLERNNSSPQTINEMSISSPSEIINSLSYSSLRKDSIAFKVGSRSSSRDSFYSTSDARYEVAPVSKPCYQQDKFPNIQISRLQFGKIPSCFLLIVILTFIITYFI